MTTVEQWDQVLFTENHTAEYAAVRPSTLTAQFLAEEFEAPSALGRLHYRHGSNKDPLRCGPCMARTY